MSYPLFLILPTSPNLSSTCRSPSFSICYCLSVVNGSQSKLDRFFGVLQVAVFELLDKKQNQTLKPLKETPNYKQQQQQNLSIFGPLKKYWYFEIDSHLLFSHHLQCIYFFSDSIHSLSIPNCINKYN